MIQITGKKILKCILILSFFLLCLNVYHFLIKINEISELYKKKGIIFQVFQPHKHGRMKLPHIKYVLIWTNPNKRPFVYLGNGQTRFIKNRCPFINCYVTTDRYFLKDYVEFDAILFAAPDLAKHDLDLPDRRSANQKYVFTSIESSENYPLCSKRFNNYFNWTWTYRLDSESQWGYITIRNNNNTVIGPNQVMHWIKLNKMHSVGEKFKKNLLSKTKAAAWFVSNCHTKSGREDFVQKLKLALEVYGLSIDTYGECGDLKCPKENQTLCDELIKRTYYFYLAFENSIAPDYITEKILFALRNNAVPIVYGGANYTRFMPEGIYLDARKLGPQNLADKMNELIKNPKKYIKFFKWTNHYTYHMRNESVKTDDYCRMCKLLNNEKMVKTKSSYINFQDWWTLPNTC